MDKATYNNLRLKAYYWEKQIAKGRQDLLAQQKHAYFKEMLGKAKTALEAEKAKSKAEKKAEEERKALEWRKNVRRKTTAFKGYDSITLKQLERSLENWQPNPEVVFQ